MISSILISLMNNGAKIDFLRKFQGMFVTHVPISSYLCPRQYVSLHIIFITEVLQVYHYSEYT